MFRAAAARTARVAARSAASQPSISSQLVAAAKFARPTTAARLAPAATWSSAVRFYSAAAGLKKEEVEGRIMSLLQGFDKVSEIADRRDLPP